MRVDQSDVAECARQEYARSQQGVRVVRDTSAQQARRGRAAPD